MDWREQANICEQKLPTMRPYPSPNDTSSQGSCNRYPRNHYDDTPMRIKFICNFGGRFLPRPSDGQLRYVGGERHLIKISRDISWQELICKTAKLIRQAHLIKYHLPGEQMNMLISITCDDDLRNMIDECIVLERTKAWLTVYLFVDNDDERHVHSVLSSSNTDKEAQFIALVNGLVGPGEELRKQSLRSTSINDLDQSMLDINEERLRTNRTNKASMYLKSKLSQSTITVQPKTSREQLENMPPSSKTAVTNQDYKAQSNEGNPLCTARKTNNAHLGSSVPSESTCVGKVEAGAHVVSRHHPGLRQTATNMSRKSNKATEDRVKGSPRKQLLVPVENRGVKVVSSNSNNNNPMMHVSIPVYEKAASLSGGPEKTVSQLKNSDDNKMKLRTYSTQEEAVCHSASHNKMEMPKHSHDFGTHPRCHDDMNKSTNLHILERPITTNSREKQQPAVICTDILKKNHPPEPTRGETVLSCSSQSSDRTTELQKNILVRYSSERQQERPNSPKPDEHLSTTARSRSVGAERISPQIITPQQETKGNVAPLIRELEVSETKDSEQALPANAVMGRELISNVQIINNVDLEDLREIGSGAFGTVLHGRWKGTDVAIKRIKNSCFMYPSSQADKLITEFWREAAIISKLHHPNILALYGVVNNGPGGTLATVTEFMINGSLKKVLHKDKCLDWRKRIMLAMDAAIGMEYLHSKDIVHFDLKCDNLLVNIKDPSRPICKVADFGLSKMKQATLVSGGMRGTLPWMAPELLTMNGTKVSEKVDVYSFGIVMWEILTGEDPYDGMHYGGVIGGILSNKLRPPVPTSCNLEWRTLMEQCWSTEPEQRPSFTEVATRLRSMLEASQSVTP